MKVRPGKMLALFSGALLLAGCVAAPSPTPQPASVTVMVDLAGGGAGFQVVVRAQEVHTGKTYSLVHAAGSHGGVVLSQSPPLVFSVDAPGTYIFYAAMLNAPDDYHFGATGCEPGAECTSTVLKAVDVVPGGTYQVYISDRSGERHAPQPTPRAPVTVPWTK